MIAPAPDDWLGQRIARAIREALEVRAGQVLTPELIEDRSRNGACWVLEAIHEFNQAKGG